MPLQEQLEQCECDTRRLLGVGAANRLARWRQCGSEQERVNFIGRIIANAENRANGFELHRRGGVCLEAIVINRPDLFSPEQLRLARETLGIAALPAAL